MVRKEILKKMEELNLKKQQEEEQGKIKQENKLKQFEKEKQDKIFLVKPQLKYIYKEFKKLHLNPNTKEVAPFELNIFEYDYDRWHWMKYQDKEFRVGKYSLSIISQSDSSPLFSAYLLGDRSKYPLPLFEFCKNLHLDYYSENDGWGNGEHSRTNRYFSIDEFLECELPFIPGDNHSLKDGFDKHLEWYLIGLENRK